MDNLTHSLVGVLLSKSGLGRVSKCSHGTLLCVVAANAPDLDIVTGLVSPALYLAYHRHLTHSLYAIPLMALVAVALTHWVHAGWRRVRRRPAAPPGSFWWEWLVAALVGTTHPLLDWTNAYGTRLWLPFSNAWNYGDLLFIIDLIVWAILVIATTGAWRFRKFGIRIAAAGLLVLTLYIASNEIWRRRVVRFAQSQTYAGAAPLEVGAYPAPGTPLDWIAYARTEQAQFTSSVNAWALDSLNETIRHAPPANQAAIDAAKGSRLGGAYSNFARYPVQQVAQADGKTQVTLADARFFRGETPVFSCVISLDDALKVLTEQFKF